MMASPRYRRTRLVVAVQVNRVLGARGAMHGDQSWQKELAMRVNWHTTALSQAFKQKLGQSASDKISGACNKATLGDKSDKANPIVPHAV